MKFYSAISCKNLFIGYKKKINEIPLNIEIPLYSWVGIIGENGSGKSTFLKTLLGIVKPISGNIQLHGKIIKDFQKYVSYCPQDREIELSQHMTGESLIQASYGKKLGIPSFGRTFREKLRKVLKTTKSEKFSSIPFNKLSGGEKKKIYISQSLMNDPKILLLDEPLNHLDPMSKISILRSLRQSFSRKKFTLMIISHETQEIKNQLDYLIEFGKEPIFRKASDV